MSILLLQCVTGDWLHQEDTCTCTCTRIRSMQGLIAFFFENGLIHHRDLAETLQALYLARGEKRSEDRDQYINHLKMTGKYREEYER